MPPPQSPTEQSLPNPQTTPPPQQQPQQTLTTIQSTIQTLLNKFNLQTIEQIAHITLDPELSALFKNKFPQHFSIQPSLTQKLKKMSLQHTYHQMYIYYEQFPIYLEQCRKVLKYKYHQDDILRTHHNRKSIWLLCSGALNKIKQNPGFYEKLTIYRQSYPQFFKHTIQKDVVRTIYDKNNQAQQILSSILRNFAIRNPYIGYCQGMNFIVNFLILMQFTQQQAFWITVQLIENFLPKTYYTNMMGVAVDICIVQHYIKLHYPALHEKLQEMNLSLSLFILQWLVCLFTSTLPFYMLVIVWDMMFIYGPSVLLKVCVVILDELQQTILHTNDISELLVMIDAKKKGIFIQESKFISRINNIYIDEELLQLCRDFIELKLLKQKAQLNQDVKRTRKHLQTECNIQWPICFKALKQHKSDMGEIQVWTFKDQGSFRVINDYLIIKNKKSYKPHQDNRSDVKKLQIGRIPHICNPTQYNKKQQIGQQTIQLEQFDIFNRKMVIQSLSIWSSKLKIENSHISFFQKTNSSSNLQFLQQYPNNISEINKIQQTTKSTSNSNQTIVERSKLLQQTMKNEVQNVKPQLQEKILSQNQINDEQENQETKKTRNPFKKLRNKWRQRKLKNTQE